MRFGKPRKFPERERVVTFCIVQKVTKKHARTCKKLPVASFCASETAETGRIVNGREQGDHVSRRQAKGFNWLVRICCFSALIRGLQNLETPCKGDVFTFFLRRAKRTKKHARGLRTSGLRGRFKALPEVILQKFPAACDETGFAHKTPA